VGAEPVACGAAVAAWQRASLPDGDDFNRIAALLMQGDPA
jgi:hypothetical protein